MDSLSSPPARRAEPATHEAHAPDRKPFLKTPLGWTCVGFAMLAVIFLFTEHTAHVFRALPWLVVLACPLLHVFLHRGHRHGPGGAEGKR